jgi:hypothetical protein
MKLKRWTTRAAQKIAIWKNKHEVVALDDGLLLNKVGSNCQKCQIDVSLS